MAITLNPPIDNLGIMAPVLGPWFSDAAVNLDVPDPADLLRLTVNFAAATDWFAPATGTLSLFVTGGATPPALDALQDSSGAWPFPAGRIVALFRLLPEVEARLHALVGLIPAATSDPVDDPPTEASAPTRPQVRSLAIVLPAGTPLTPAGIYPFFGGEAGIPGDDAAEKMAAIGLAIEGGALVNAALPMTWLRRPGGEVADRDVLLQDLVGNVDLWAFDRRGRAIDPGAVACWWSWLLSTAVGDDPATGDADIQLLAPDIDAADYPQQGGQPVVVQFAAQRTAHLVDAHEGPLAAPFLGDRLQVDGAVANAALVQVGGDDDIALTFAPLPPPGAAPTIDNPQVDNAPRARMAVLPTGNYGVEATLWPGGPVHAGLTRDFVRVAVVDEERHLVGLERRDSRAGGTLLERRQSAQNRPSTRIHVNRTSTADGVLLANSRAAADALLALPNPTDPTRMVLGLGDFAWGGTPGAAAPTPGAGPLPSTLADSGAAAPAVGEYRVRALTGGGALAEDHQTVLLEVNLGPACAGAWVRAWPLGFNLDIALHFRTSGGAGRVNAAGLAHLTMVLIDGTLGASGLLGMDTLVLLPDATGAVAAQRRYADRRFTRPAPVGGAAATTIAGDWVVCETGATGTGALPGGAVPPGGHVVLLSGTPAIVDRTAIPAAAWDDNTLRNRLQATDIVSLTSPAYGSTPDRASVTGRPLPRTPTAGGDPRGGLDTIVGNRLHYLDRGLLASATASSVPYTLLDRLEVAAATTGDDAATAVIGAAPAVPWALEPTRDFFLGHPGVPAAIEIHGTGVSLTGAPAVAVAEYVRERTAGLSFPEVQALTEPVRSAAIQSELAVAAEAATPLPTIADGEDAGPVVAVLRTSALGMEGVPGVGYAAVNDPNIFPLSQNEAALEAWLDANITIAGGAGTALRDAIGDEIDSITRALDRRLFTAAHGARDTFIALREAIARAQDFVYIETPAVDDLETDAEDVPDPWWDLLLARMAARTGLRVILCVPTQLGPGTPERLQEVRDFSLLKAVDAMRAAAPDRFALFSPGAGAGRAVRFASTSVVIDDAFALTGTTHLWRRGLTWDSSLAAAVFDERVIDGRPQDVRAFRIQLLADRLGIPTTRVPDDPAELVRAIRELDARGSNRLSVTSIVNPTETPTNAELDAWNADGTRSGLDFNFVAALLVSFLAFTDVEHAIVEG